MTKKKKSGMKARRYEYNKTYQKQYIRRYVFKLNMKHDAQLIELLEKMDNRSEWFKQRLLQEL
ncbi:MAG: hypothetical protein PUE44_02475 [Bulleidia sp.]|nr:hypothetical protein [Bulleidia sp.]